MILVTASGKTVYQGSESAKAKETYDRYVERTETDKQFKNEQVLLYVNGALLFAHNQR
jgi:hypothetical protein